MKGPKKKQTNTQEGWQPAMNAVENTVLPGMMQWGQTPQSYTGPSYIGPNANMQAGQAGATGWAGGGGQEMVNQTLGAYSAALDPSQFMRAQGAYSPLDTYATQVGRVLNEQQLPGARDSAMAAGQYGGYSSKRGNQDALMRSRASGDIAQFGANLTGQLFGQGLQARNMAMGQGSSMYNLGLDPSRTLYNTGEQQRGEQYTQQNMANQATNFAQNEPMQRYSQLAPYLQNFAGLGGTSTSEESTSRDMLGTIASLGAMGASLYTGGATGGLGSVFGLGGAGPNGGTIAPRPYDPNARRGGMLVGGMPW